MITTASWSTEGAIGENLSRFILADGMLLGTQPRKHEKSWYRSKSTKPKTKPGTEFRQQQKICIPLSRTQLTAENTNPSFQDSIDSRKYESFFPGQNSRGPLCQSRKICKDDHCKLRKQGAIFHQILPGLCWRTGLGRKISLICSDFILMCVVVLSVALHLFLPSPPTFSSTRQPEPAFLSHSILLHFARASGL